MNTKNRHFLCASTTRVNVQIFVGSEGTELENVVEEKALEYYLSYQK